MPHSAVWTLPGVIGKGALLLGLLAAIATMCAYGMALARPERRAARRLGRIFYTITALSLLTAFGMLAAVAYGYHFEYQYVWEHSGTGMSPWYRFAASWSGQEGSFLLWGAWTSLIGFLVFAKAGKYEARVMPFYVTVMAFLCAILLKQSPFNLIPVPSAADLLANPGWHFPPIDGQGLNPSLQNYWMTIHPPTIFFGFSSLLVPFCYAIAALIWKDYDGWTGRVMPYSLLSCGVLGIGLFMGGYWAYETLGWHGFWAWDPVENASFFPWLAITALVHGLVVLKSRGGMARTNTFLGLLAFWLFLLGTFLTRSGALASKDENGQLLSVHAFDDIGKSALWLMASMLIVYGGGALALWLARVWKMPRRPAMGDTLVSRDFALFLAVLLMLLCCAVVTLGATWPLTLSLLHRPPSAPKPLFYNKAMMPLAMLMALVMGCVPWLAWRKTNPDTFLRKLLVPWFAMILFGFLMLIWVLGAERAVHQMVSPDAEVQMQTMRAWISPSLQRVSVIALASLGFLAAFSNAMLAYRVFKARKPFSAGGWLAHVGMGVLVIGIIVSNTYERTERLVLTEGGAPVQAFGYTFSFEKMTGTAPAAFPDHPDYDQNNAVEIRVTPPDGVGAHSADGSRTFLIHPNWFVYNMHTAESAMDLQRMMWPSIQKDPGHDLYVSLAGDAQYEWPTDDPHQEEPGITLLPKEKRQIGPYTLGYFAPHMEPGKYMSVQLGLVTPEGKVLAPHPGILIDHGMMPVDVAVPELMDGSGKPAVIYLQRLDATTKAATLNISLPGYTARWAVPLEVTYKPWINLVWLGVLIAVGGVFLAMIRRIGEARRLGETADLPSGSSLSPLEGWEIAPDGEPVAVVSPSPVAAPANGKNGVHG